MPALVNEIARIVSNVCVGPRLHVMVLKAPQISAAVKPGQFIHMKIPGFEEHILRRPFSVYSTDHDNQTIEVLYQEIGSLTRQMPSIEDCDVQIIGPIGNTWSAMQRYDDGTCTHALIVGGGVGAAPLFMMTKELRKRNCALDVILGAQTFNALVTRDRYTQLLDREPFCATDDGSYGRAGFCTFLVEELLADGCSIDGKAYDYLAVCGPEPLMRIVADMGAQAHVYTEISMEKRMACGVGACLSCVVDTVDGKLRSCVDGPIFDASKVVW